MLGAAYVRGLQRRRGRRHAQALRRLLGARGRRRNHGPVPDGPARAPGRACCRRSRRAVRDRRPLGHELLLRRRRRPGRRRPVAAHRPAARRLGLHRHRGVRLLGASPFLAVACTGSPADAGGGGRAGARRGHRRRAAGHARLRRGARRAGPRAARCPEELVDRAARRLLRAEGASSGCSTRTGRPRRRSPARPARPRPAANRALAREMAERSVVLLDAAGGALPLGDGAALGSPWSGRAPPTRARSWAATPSPTTCCRATRTCGSASRCRPLLDALRPELPGAEIAHERGLRGPGRRPVRLRGRGRRRPRRRPLRRRRRRPGRPVRARARPARAATPRTCGCPACRPTCWPSCSTPARRVVVVVVSGRPYALGDVTPRGRGGRPGVHAGRGGRRGESPASCPAGSSPAASCRCRSPARPGGQPAPTCSRRSAANSGGSARSTRPRCSRSATAPRTPRSRSTTCAQPRRGADRRRVRRCPCRSATPATAPATRPCSSTCTTCVAQVTRPVLQLAGFARVGARRRRARRGRASAVHADRTAFTGLDLQPDRRARRDRGHGRAVGRDLPCGGRSR